MKSTAAEELMAVYLDELRCEWKDQYPYAEGRKLKADFVVWKTHNPLYDPGQVESGLLVEIQGGIFMSKGPKCSLCGRANRGAHGSVQGIKRDLDRAQQAVLNGWYWLPVTPQQVEDGSAKEMIRKWLEG